MIQKLIFPLQVLFRPFETLEIGVRQKRYVLALVLTSIATALSGAALAWKLDASSVVLAAMAADGELAKASEREVVEQIDQSHRIALVKGVATGVFLVPLITLAIALGLKIVCWIIGRKGTFASLLSAVALALVPFGVLKLIEAISAMNQVSLTPTMVEAFLPTSLSAIFPEAAPRMRRVYVAVDFINLWVAGLMGIGFSVATAWKPSRGVALTLALYLLFAGALLVGLPGLISQEGV